MLESEIKRLQYFVEKTLDKIPEKWREVYNKYLLESGTNSLHTKSNVLQVILSFWQATKIDDPKKVTRKDVEKWIAKMREKYSQETVNRRISTLKTLLSTYFYGYRSRKYPKCVQWIKVRQPKNNNMRDKILSPGEIDALIRTCNNSKQKALVAIMYEGALRLGEALSLRLRDVEFTKYGVRIRVLGKTGERTILLFKSEPYIREWIQAHPLKSDPNAYLFVSKWGGKWKQMTPPAVIRWLKRLAKSAGIKKRVHPHMLRHTRLTELAKVLTEQELKLLAGWEKDSRMAKVYVHLSGRDLEKAMLEKIAGVRLEEEESKEPQALEPKICPRCGAKNPFDALYCYKCALVLDNQVAAKLHEKEQEAGNKVKQLVKALMELMEENPEFARKIAEKLKKFAS